MTPAERKRASRARQADNDSVEFVVKLSGGKLNFITRVAAAHGCTRVAFVAELLDMAIAKVVNTTAEAELLRDEGKSQEEIDAFMSAQYRDTIPRPEAVQKFKEVLGII